MSEFKREFEKAFEQYLFDNHSAVPFPKTAALWATRFTLLYAARVAENESVAELRELGRGELRKFSGKKVRGNIASHLTKLAGELT